MHLALITLTCCSMNSSDTECYSPHRPAAAVLQTRSHCDTLRELRVMTILFLASAKACLSGEMACR